jgi:hypothetical protein
LLGLGLGLGLGLALGLLRFTPKSLPNLSIRTVRHRLKPIVLVVR